jgi:CRISPR-associated protein Csm4
MNEYRDYTIEVSLKSPIVTQFQSDTIFGHICWAIRFIYGEASDKINVFLNSYDNSEYPPLLVTNGFPKGYLSKPIIQPIKQEELESIVDTEDRIENSFKIKNIKKIEYITKDHFNYLQKERITPIKLFRIMFDKYDSIVSDLSKEQSSIVQHNTINRIEGIVKTGGLYSQEEFFYDFEDINSGIFEIYLKTHFFSKEELKRIFEYIKIEGFGKDKSTGRGYFDFEIKDGIDLPESENPNAFMTLSSYIPAEMDPVKGYYQTFLKFGKLGGLYAKGTPEVGGNPFKKPLIMFSAGSTFYDSNFSCGKTYGSLLNDVHPNNKIRHYALAFPLGIHLEDNHEEI